MKKISIILSLDYELFGDGSGDVYREQIIPTNHLMDICDQYGAKITCFCEMGQFFFYEENRDQFRQLGVYNDAISEQLKQLVLRGHDVQFHYHPTWFNASISNEGNISLDLKMFDISQLKYADQVKLLKQGKVYLENLLKPVDPEYKCIAFRAGALTIGNQKEFIEVLSEAGYLIDSTIAPHATYDAVYGKYNYKKFPLKMPYWQATSSLQEHNKTGPILELPILVEKNIFSLFRYLNSKYSALNKIRSKFYRTNVSQRDLNILRKIKKLLTRNYCIADFNNLSPNALSNIIKNYAEQFNSDFDNIPINLMGHSKSSYFNDDLHLLFNNLANSGLEVQYETVSSFYRKIKRI